MFGHAYPTKPDGSQQNLSTGGVLSGYFLHEIQRAFFSILSFEAYCRDIIHFTVTIRDPLKNSKAAGMTTTK